MKVIVIGATGIIGGAVASALEERHEVVRAARSGPARVDMTDPDSVDALLASDGGADAVVCCAASGGLTPVDADVPDAEFLRGLDGKLLGQVALVRRAARRLREGGSVTLTGGVFERPTPGGAFGALVNAGLRAFVRAAAEMPRGLRLNAVAPGWVAETLERMGPDAAAAAGARPGDGTPVAVVARAYVEAVEGTARGRVLTP